MNTSDDIAPASDTENRPRILLADDSKVIRTSAARILGEEFDVLLAVDGQDAWEQLTQQDDISAVFTDIGMPYLNGLELLAKIREHADESLSAMPVIVVTGDETDEAREDALRRGATDFITKPFNRIDLLARARSHATAQRERRELAKFTTIDRLTRLGNEQRFVSTLNEALSFAQRHNQPLSVMRLHVENLKSVAREGGKELLLRRMRELGAVIRACIRKEDTAARLGAVHFGVVIPVCTTEGAQRLARRIQLTLEAASRRAGWETPLRFNIGISTPSLFPDAGFEELMADLEAAARTAGNNGGIAVSQATLSQAGGSMPLDLGTALRLLAEGRPEQVRPQLEHLLTRVSPLIEFARREDEALLRRLLG